MPPRNRPETSPDPDGGFDLPQSFHVLLEGIEALTETVAQQTEMMSRQMNAQARFAMAGSARAQGAEHAAGLMQASMRPQMRRDVMQGLAATGGLSPDLTAGMTKMTGIGAATGLKNLQAYGAQWLGERIAGQSLYEEPQQGSRGGSTTSGTVPGSGAPAAPPPAGASPSPSAPMPPPAGGLGWPAAAGGPGGGGRTGAGSGGSGGRGGPGGGGGGGQGGSTRPRPGGGASQSPPHARRQDSPGSAPGRPRVFP